MKILYLLGSLNRGGAETLILDIFKNARNYQLEFFCTFRYRNGIFEKDFFESDAKIQYIAYKGNLIFSYLKKLRTYIKSNQIDIIHAHQPIDAFYAIIATFGLKIPVFLTLHSYDFETRGIAKIALIFALKKANMNIYVSETQKKYYLKKYHTRSNNQMVMYNGISFEKFNCPNPVFSTDLRKELSIAENKLILVSVGNFTEVRNQLLICMFIEKLKKSFTNFHFVFVGSKVERFPEFYEKCVDYCSENGLDSYVSFVGSRNDVPQILAQSDAFIYYTNYDTFGIAVVEAMAAGIPVFVNDWDVMKEITENGVYATLYNSNDINDLLNKFNLFLSDKSVYRTQAQRASITVRNQFGINNYIYELEKLYLKFGS